MNTVKDTHLHILHFHPTLWTLYLRTHTHTHSCTHTHARTHTHTHAHTRTHTCTHTHTHAHTHTLTRTHTHSHTHTNKHMHTHTQTSLLSVKATQRGMWREVLYRATEWVLVSRQAPPPWPPLGTPHGRCRLWYLSTMCAQWSTCRRQ